MRHKLLLLLGLLLLSQFALADQVFTPDHRLRLVAVPDPDPSVRYYYVWKGALPVQGILQVEFIRDAIQEPPTILFFPDTASMKRLPWVKDALPHPRPLELGVAAKPRQLLTQLLGAKATAELYGGQQQRYEYPVRLLITRLESGVDCDHRWYTLYGTRWQLRRPHQLSQALPDISSC